MAEMVAEVPVISLRLYTKWSKIGKTGGKLESQGFSFFTVVKISTTKDIPIPCNG